MTTFEDGPAAGVVLELRRAPLFLRAVRTPGGAWDALDELEDLPAADETIAVYARQGAPGRIHVDPARPRRAVWLAVAWYRVVTPAPPDAEIRDTARWRQWCTRQQEAIRCSRTQPTPAA